MAGRERIISVTGAGPRRDVISDVSRGTCSPVGDTVSVPAGAGNILLQKREVKFVHRSKTTATLRIGCRHAAT